MNVYVCMYIVVVGTATGIILSATISIALLVVGKLCHHIATELPYGGNLWRVQTLVKRQRKHH